MKSNLLIVSDGLLELGGYFTSFYLHRGCRVNLRYEPSVGREVCGPGRGSLGVRSKLAFFSLFRTWPAIGYLLLTSTFSLLSRTSPLRVLLGLASTLELTGLNSPEYARLDELMW